MKCPVNPQNLNHALTIGCNFLRQIGIDILPSQSKVTWHGKEMPLHPQNCLDDKQTFNQVLTNEPHSTAESHANVVHEDAATKCKETDLNQLVSQQSHLTLEHKAMLLKTLKTHNRLCEGLANKQLGIFPN